MSQRMWRIPLSRWYTSDSEKPKSTILPNGEARQAASVAYTSTPAAAGSVHPARAEAPTHRWRQVVLCRIEIAIAIRHRETGMCGYSEERKRDVWGERGSVR